MTDELPKEVSRSLLQIGPIEIEVVQLDDGRRLVTAEGLAKFMDWLATGGGESVEDGDT
jgi:hypothetical protein